MARRRSQREDFGDEHTIARLVIVEAAGVGAIYPLYGQPVVIGRLGSNDLQLDDGTVSRVHARVDLEPPGFCIEDLGSRGGTLVNGERIQGRRALRDGDEIRIGRVSLRFER